VEETEKAEAAMKIFEPIEIRGMRLKNRIAFPPYLHQPSGQEGSGVTDLTIKWFQTIAEGGVGLVMTGAISPFAIAGWPRLTLGDDSCIEGFARLAEAVHAAGARIGTQIAMGGPLTGTGWSLPPYPDARRGKETVFALMGQSGTAFGAPVPVREIPIEEAELYENAIAAAAGRAKAAGLDCVLLHCAHGGATMGASSISPFYNRRTDKYGGSWEKRMTWARRTIQKMRAAVGDDFPIHVRMNATDLLGSWGTTIEDACNYVVPALEEAGADCLDVSQGCIVRTPHGITIPPYYPRGFFIENAAAVRKVTKLPVIGVGRIIDIDMANRFIEEGKADIIYLGRQMIADPDSIKKYVAGKPDEIRHCIGCLQGCGPCAINYDLPQNNPLPIVPAEKPKRVLVIGGGIAGMEAARIAALRGHMVTLIEKGRELGGTVAALAIDPLLAEFRNVVDYLAAQMTRLRVDTRICREATVDDIEELKPDVVILATGSSLTLPEVARGKPGVMTHIEALRRKREIGKKVVIWGFLGQELAVSLAEEGKDVVLMGAGSEDALVFGAGGYILPFSSRRVYMLKKLTDIDFVRPEPEDARLENAEVLYRTEVQDIADGVINVSFKGGGTRTIPYDTLIVSLGRRRNDALLAELQGRVQEIHKIGDCERNGNINHAIQTANEVARKI
jgi:2,4-dienoyl-CoA reductase-like NADH-dependent reductase (Old Yellow Enzyme family)/thioredoxin reductase